MTESAALKAAFKKLIPSPDDIEIGQYIPVDPYISIELYLAMNPKIDKYCYEPEGLAPSTSARVIFYDKRRNIVAVKSHCKVRASGVYVMKRDHEQMGPVSKNWF